VWNFLTVRLADEHIKETKFPRNGKTSQQTKSVAKSAGGLEIVRPKTKAQQGFAVEITSVRHTFAKPFVSRSLACSSTLIFRLQPAKRSSLQANGYWGVYVFT